ncbi:MAG: hypothetical protein JOY71_06370 [Acetobacteraceae bacterium]|nr:hypothetical protein [Acetobacteraceae bacterium]MBV8521739.1 hypothetical protein [Acetobacteraceae bacterium]
MSLHTAALDLLRRHSRADGTERVLPIRYCDNQGPVAILLDDFLGSRPFMITGSRWPTERRDREELE